MLGTVLIVSKTPRRRPGWRWAAITAAAALVLGACSSGDITGTAPDDLTIVATTSIAGDLVAQVVGQEATVRVLMPVGTDPHDFQPSSQQVAELRRADLVVAWGLGLEQGLADVLAGIASDGGRVLEISALVDPIEFMAEHDDHGDDDHALDPHTWMDPVRMAEAARLIGQALHEIAPDGGWVDEGERVAEELRAVHEQVAAILATIPEPRRKLVTNHDSLGYLADRYDFEVVGVAIPGGSTLAAPSSAQIASLVEAVRQSGVTVLFAETTSPAALLEAIAGEIEGVRVVEILEGSLAPPGEPGDTLAGMLVHNAEVIAAALGEG